MRAPKGFSPSIVIILRCSALLHQIVGVLCRRSVALYVARFQCHLHLQPRTVKSVSIFVELSRSLECSFIPRMSRCMPCEAQRCGEAAFMRAWKESPDALELRILSSELTFSLRTLLQLEIANPGARFHASRHW